MTGMLNEKVVSKLILNKLAESGLDLSQLILAYKRDNEKGIQSVLSEKMKGRPCSGNSYKIHSAENPQLHRTDCSSLDTYTSTSICQCHESSFCILTFNFDFKIRKYSSIGLTVRLF